MPRSNKNKVKAKTCGFTHRLVSGSVTRKLTYLASNIFESFYNLFRIIFFIGPFFFWGGGGGRKD